MRLMTLAVVVGLLPMTHTAVNASGTFDGVYTGAARETLNNNGGRYLNLGRATEIVVVDDTFHYKWVRDMEAKVRADGSFFVSALGRAARGASPSVSVQGRIAGGKLEADVGGDRCAVHLSLTKIG